MDSAKILGDDAAADGGEGGVIVDSVVVASTTAPGGVRVEVADAVADACTEAQSRRWPQYLAASAATLAAFAGGTVLAWTSPAIPLLQRPDAPFTVTDDEASWIGAVMPLGAVLGSPPYGLLVQKLGRKRAVLALAPPFLLSWLTILAARGVLWLYAARLLAGLALGGVTVACPIYVAEVAEDAIRGRCGSLLQVMFNGGMLFAYAVGAVEIYALLSWACAAVPVLFVAAFAGMPETPAALLARGGEGGGEEAAARSLRWLRRWPAGADGTLEAVEVEMSKLRRGQALANGVDSDDTQGGGLLARLGRPVARKALLIALGLVAAQQLSGVCAIVFYAESIFRATGTSLSPAGAAVSVGATMFYMAFVTTAVVDRVARRTLLLRSASFMGLSLSTLAAFFQLQALEVDTAPFSFLPILAISAFIVAYCLGLGTLPWTIMAEVLPADIKGPAGSMVSSFCYLLSFVVTKSFQSIVDYSGTHSAFWLFAGFCGLTVVFVIFIVPETKGKSLEQIQRELAN